MNKSRTIMNGFALIAIIALFANFALACSCFEGEDIGESPLPIETEAMESRYEGKTLVGAEVLDYIGADEYIPSINDRVSVDWDDGFYGILTGYAPQILDYYKNSELTERAKKYGEPGDYEARTDPERIKMAEAIQKDNLENVLFYVKIYVFMDGEQVTASAAETKRLKDMGYDVELTDDGIYGYLSREQVLDFPASEDDMDLEYNIALARLHD